MGSAGSASEPLGNDAPSLTIDPHALFEALTGRKIDRRSMSSNTMSEKFDDLVHIEHDNETHGREPSPDPHPEDVHVGVINPYALVEAIIGRQLDKHSLTTARIISDVLQTDYDELFDMKYQSSLFAGLKFNQGHRKSEQMHAKEVKILSERDLVTPDLSAIQQMHDLEKIGFKNMGEARVKMARMQNGKLRLVIDAHNLGKKITNSEVTYTLNELALPFRENKGHWTLPNSTWRDALEASMENLPRRLMLENQNQNMMNMMNRNECSFHRMNKFDNPIQGASTNSWLIAAIFSVFWADPAMINRSVRRTREKFDTNDEKKRMLSIKFFDKGGRNNAHTATIDVNYEVPINNSSNQPVYCRSSDGDEIWPCLYEKAYAKWITGGSSNHPDITQTHNGDPIKTMAQINGKKPFYYFTEKHSAGELVGLVRSSCVNLQTINPMAAWTYPTGHVYRGSNLVANHAYSILGWARQGEKQYIILRNPWGVSEPIGQTSYPGMLDRVEREFWHPACLLDNGGVLALEASAFKEYFACLGVAKDFKESH